MTEILREPGRVANGLSTITARLTKKNDEYIKSITGGQGVIDEQTGELRSTFEILQDLSEAWGDLTSVERQELTEVVAGKTQRSLFTALMANFKTAVDATGTALDSEGSAMRENDKRMDSLAGKVKKLQSAWQDLSQKSINSEFVKRLLDVATTALKIVKNIGGLPVILLGIASALAMIKAESIAILGTKIGDAITSVINGFKILQQRIFGASGANTIYIGTTKALTVEQQKAAVATTALGAAMAVITIAAAAAMLAVNAYKDNQAKLIEANEEAAEKHLQQADSLEKLKNTYSNLTSKQNRTKKENEQLSKTIDDLSQKYGLEKSTLEATNETREEAIKKIQAEIDKRKALAGIEQESAIEYSIRQAATEKPALTSMDDVSAKISGLRGQYDLQASTIAKLQEKTSGYIETLENKNERTKDEQKDLDKLQVFYKDLTTRISAFNQGYKQSLENLKSGIPITNDQAKALYQLGHINSLTANAIIRYNTSGEDQKKISWEVVKAAMAQDEALKNQEEDTDAVADAINEAIEAQDNYNSALNDNIDTLTDYQSHMDILTAAQKELADNGSLTAETFKSLYENDLLQYLEETENGLRINTQALTDNANATKEAAVANLQAQAAEQIQAIILGDLQGKFSGLTSEQIKASTRTKKTGNNASDAAPKFLELANNVATAGNAYENFYKQMGGGTAGTPQYQPISEEAKNAIQDVIKETLAAGKALSKVSFGTSSSSKSSRGSGGSGKSSKSSKEVYKAEIDTLYKYKNALDNAKDAVDRLDDALSNTKNFNEREKYLKQLVKATQNQIKATNNLRNAQTKQINDYIKQLRKQGFQISYNSKTNELNINNMERLGKFSGDTAKNLEKMIDKIQDLNSDNRNLSSSIRDLNSDIADFNDQIKSLPEEKLEKFNELMEEFQQSRLDQIQNQITDLQHEMENDPRLKALEEQIDALEKQNDELDSQKELEEKLLAVEEAKIKLQNAQKQRNFQIYRENQRMGKNMPSNIVICCVISNYIG